MWYNYLHSIADLDSGVGSTKLTEARVPYLPPLECRRRGAGRYSRASPHREDGTCKELATFQLDMGI